MVINMSISRKSEHLIPEILRNVENERARSRSMAPFRELKTFRDPKTGKKYEMRIRSPSQRRLDDKPSRETEVQVYYRRTHQTIPETQRESHRNIHRARSQDSDPSCANVDVRSIGNVGLERIRSQPTEVIHHHYHYRGDPYSRHSGSFQVQHQDNRSPYLPSVSSRAPVSTFGTTPAYRPRPRALPAPSAPSSMNTWLASLPQNMGYGLCAHQKARLGHSLEQIKVADRFGERSLAATHEQRVREILAERTDGRCHQGSRFCHGPTDTAVEYIGVTLNDETKSQVGLLV